MGGPLFSGLLLGTMLFPFDDNGFDGALLDHERSGYSFITQPWLVWRSPWSSCCCLVSGRSCLMVLQPLRLFRKGVYSTN